MKEEIESRLVELATSTAVFAGEQLPEIANQAIQWAMIKISFFFVISLAMLIFGVVIGKKGEDEVANAFILVSLLISSYSFYQLFKVVFFPGLYIVEMFIK